MVYLYRRKIVNASQGPFQETPALVGVVTNKPPCLFTTCLKVVGDNTNNGTNFNQSWDYRT
jgi:hypothetical protein